MSEYLSDLGVSPMMARAAEELHRALQDEAVPHPARIIGAGAGGRPLPRSLITVMAHAAITQGSIFVIRPTVSYRALEIGLDTVLIGVLASAYTLLSLLVAMQFGRLSDRFGERRLMLTGTAGMVLAVGVITAASDGLAVLTVASVLLGISDLAAAIGQQSVVGLIVPRSRLAAGFAYYTLTGSLGQAFAPSLIALFGADQQMPNTQGIFLVSLVLIVFALPIPLPGRCAPGTPVGSSRHVLGRLRRIRGLPSAIGISGIVLAAIDVFTVHLPVLGLERGWTAGLVSLLLVIRAVTSLVSRVLLEPMTRWLGANRLLAGTAALAFVSMGAVPLIDSVPLLAVLMVPLGPGLGLAQPITMAWVAIIAPDGLRGSAMSLRLTGSRLGQTVMPLVAGNVAGVLSSGGVLGVVEVSLAVSAAIATRVDVADGTAR